MNLGEKLRQARLDAGMTQSQLSDGIITRNMLSLIEHGSAKPSMATLRALAKRLAVPVTEFLEPEVYQTPNDQVISEARGRYMSGYYQQAMEILDDYRTPDPRNDLEFALLSNLVRLALAELALMEERNRYGAQLLSVPLKPSYCQEYLERNRLMLLARLEPAAALALPSIDEELQLRAKAALVSGDPKRAVALLDAMEERESPQWHCLRGEGELALKHFKKALPHLELAAEAFPKEALPMLEQCCKELGDFEGAYKYAILQRDSQ